MLSPKAEGDDRGTNGVDGDGTGNPMGHSIIDEDNKEPMTAQQVEYVRQHQHQF